MFTGRQLAAFGCACAALMLISHAAFLNTPFFWDEIGQFIPAALDVFHQAALIPFSTIPNVHPPGLMIFLAGVWKAFGYSIMATRLAMLLVASAGLALTYLVTGKLCERESLAPHSALLAAGLLVVSPLWFSQSMMALLDMPAMVLMTLAFWLFLEERLAACALCCIALVLVKETALVAPAVFGIWLWKERRWREGLWFTLPAVALALWLWMLHGATGHWFGNSEFAEYNLSYPLHPVRLLMAVLRRVYFLFVANGRVVGLLALLITVRMPVFQSRGWRVAAVLTVVHTAVISVAGGAVLERYLLPVFPLCYAAFAVALEHVVPRLRTPAMAVFFVLSIAGIFVNPPYPFPLENNLAWVSFVDLEQQAASFVETTYPASTIATSFPMGGALRRAEFGFVHHDMRVLDLNDFTPGSIEKLKNQNVRALVYFNVLWDPSQFFSNPTVRSFLQCYYGYRPQASVHEVERMLKAKLVREWARDGLAMQCFELPVNLAK
jgi:hypothetical protein